MKTSYDNIKRRKERGRNKYIEQHHVIENRLQQYIKKKVHSDKGL
jgi:hypothetical protein